MKRREFGTSVLKTAAALGLRSVSPGILAALGVPVVGCSEDESGPGSLADAADAAVPPSPRAKGRSIAIVGSGYGAAVAALRLTQRGFPVTLFEMGRLWNEPGDDGKIFCSAQNADGRAMWFQSEVEAMIKTFGPFPISVPVPMLAGVLGIVGPPSMRVASGRGFGGGSLVNLAVYTVPERSLFQRAWPDVDMSELYDVYFPRAMGMMKSSRCPNDILAAEGYRYSRVGIEQCERVGLPWSLMESGYDWDYMRQEIAGAVPQSAYGGGEAGFGNNHGKRSLDKTYFADAMATGLLTVHAMHQALRVQRSPTGYVLAVREIDVSGNVLRELDHACTDLFVCAGSMGTTELFLRARDSGALPDLSAAVGTEWGPNSNVFTIRKNSLWQPTGALQATVPNAVFQTRDSKGRFMTSLIDPLPLGFETYLSHNIVIVENPEQGHFRYDSATDEVSLVWHQGQNDPAIESLRQVFDPMNQASQSDYTGDFYGGELFADKNTYHPLGGMPLGKATDLYGRIPQYPGLYAIDASILPTAFGATPALSVAAVAERCMERIVREDFT